jgi:hypothetical protein
VTQTPIKETIDELRREFRDQGLPTLAEGFETSAVPGRAFLEFVGSLASAFAHGVRHVWKDKGDILASAAGRAAVVFAALVFSFSSSEVWQFFAKIETGRFFLVLGVFVLFGLWILWVTLNQELSAVFRVATRTPAKELQALGGDPAVWLCREFPVDDERRDTMFRLNWRQQTNVRIVLFAPLVTIVGLVGIFSCLFFIGLGLALVDEPLTTTLTTGGTTVLSADAWRGVSIGEGDFVLTAPLVRVSAFLGAVTAFAFTLDVLTNRDLKKKLIQDDSTNAKRLVAAWVYYKAWHDANGEKMPRRSGPTEPSSGGG